MRHSKHNNNYPHYYEYMWYIRTKCKTHEHGLFSIAKREVNGDENMMPIQ